MERFLVARARSMPPPDPELSERAYMFLAALVYRHSRIRLGPDKRAFVAGRLAGRLRAIGCGSYDDYCRLLDDPLLSGTRPFHVHRDRHPARGRHAGRRGQS